MDKIGAKRGEQAFNKQEKIVRRTLPFYEVTSDTDAVTHI